MIWLALLAALALCWASARILQGGWQGGRGFQVAGFDKNSAVLGALAVGAAVFFWGPLYGLALIIAVVVHEFGHVAAFRVCGHTDARFRLIPLFGGVAMSNQVPSSADKAFFITLMGPAINIAPMVLCLVVSDAVELIEGYDMYPLANYLFIQALVMASLNFFNLLPLWPLDGGKLTQRLTYTFAPDLTRSVSLAMIGLAVLLCLATKQLFLLFFVLSSARNLLQSEQLLRKQRPFERKTATLALGAYLATTATFFLAGRPLISGFF